MVNNFASLEKPTRKINYVVMELAIGKLILIVAISKEPSSITYLMASVSIIIPNTLPDS